MFQIFEAGGMTGLSEAEYKGWRVKFSKALDDVSNYMDFKYNIDIVDPTQYFGLDDDQVMGMDWDLHQVKKSDLLVVNFNSPSSIGTAMEVATAKENGIPIVGINESGEAIHPWLAIAVNCMVDSIETAAKYIASYYLT